MTTPTTTTDAFERASASQQLSDSSSSTPNVSSSSSSSSQSQSGRFRLRQLQDYKKDWDEWDIRKAKRLPKSSLSDLHPSSSKEDPATTTPSTTTTTTEEEGALSSTSRPSGRHYLSLARRHNGSHTNSGVAMNGGAGGARHGGATAVEGKGFGFELSYGSWGNVPTSGAFKKKRRGNRHMSQEERKSKKETKRKARLEEQEKQKLELMRKWRNSQRDLKRVSSVLMEENELTPKLSQREKEKGVTKEKKSKGKDGTAAAVDASKLNDADYQRRLEMEEEESLRLLREWRAEQKKLKELNASFFDDSVTSPPSPKRKPKPQEKDNNSSSNKKEKYKLEIKEGESTLAVLRRLIAQQEASQLTAGEEEEDEGEEDEATSVTATNETNETEAESDFTSSNGLTSDSDGVGGSESEDGSRTSTPSRRRRRCKAPVIVWESPNFKKAFSPFSSSASVESSPRQHMWTRAGQQQHHKRNALRGKGPFLLRGKGSKEEHRSHSLEYQRRQQLQQSASHEDMSSVMAMERGTPMLKRESSWEWDFGDGHQQQQIQEWDFGEKKHAESNSPRDGEGRNSITTSQDDINGGAESKDDDSEKKAKEKAEDTTLRTLRSDEDKSAEDSKGDKQVGTEKRDQRDEIKSEEAEAESRKGRSEQEETKEDGMTNEQSRRKSFNDVTKEEDNSSNKETMTGVSPEDGASSALFVATDDDDGIEGEPEEEKEPQESNEETALTTKKETTKEKDTKETATTSSMTEKLKMLKDMNAWQLPNKKKSGSLECTRVQTAALRNLREAERQRENGLGKTIEPEEEAAEEGKEKDEGGDENVREGQRRTRRRENSQESKPSVLSTRKLSVPTSAAESRNHSSSTSSGPSGSNQIVTRNTAGANDGGRVLRRSKSIPDMMFLRASRRVVIDVSVVEAKNLDIEDSKAVPCCVVELRGTQQRFKTSRKDDANPTWNSHLTFTYFEFETDAGEFWKEAYLDFTVVYRPQKSKRKSHTLGKVSLNPSSLQLGAIYDLWLDLEDPLFENCLWAEDATFNNWNNGHCHGFLHLRIQRHDDPKRSMLAHLGTCMRSIPARLAAGDIVLINEKKRLATQAVHLAIRSPWDHMGMVVRMRGEKDLVLLESTMDGVDVYFLDSRLDFYRETATLGIRRLQNCNRDNAMIQSMMNFVDSVLGKPYNKNFVQMVRGKYGQRNQQDSLSSFFCSQLVAAAYQHMGLLSPSVAANNYLPNHFEKAEAMPWLRDVSFAEIMLMPRKKKKKKGEAK
ncbi:cGMP-dependent protein kinase [Balamuthia mandrillaris]